MDHEISRGQSALSMGKASVIGIPNTVTNLTLATFLADYTAKVEPFSMAYNGQYMLDPTVATALVAWLDFDGKWYGPTGVEVV